jgi:hypothetical protein
VTSLATQYAARVHNPTGYNEPHAHQQAKYGDCAAAQPVAQHQEQRELEALLRFAPRLRHDALLRACVAKKHDRLVVCMRL